MPPGKILIIAGLALVAIGLYLNFGPRIPFLGKLPGDFHFKRDGFTVYFPLASSIIVSIIASLVLWLFKK